MMIPELMIVGPRHPPLLDPDPQRRIGVVAGVAEIAHDGEARRQHLHPVRHRLNGPQRRGIEHVGQVVDVVLRIAFVGERQVVVRVDQPRQHREPREIDDFGRRRNRDVRTDLPERAVLDEDDLIGLDPTALRIDQSARPDGVARVGRRRKRRRSLACGNGRRDERQHERNR